MEISPAKRIRIASAVEQTSKRKPRSHKRAWALLQQGHPVPFDPKAPILGYERTLLKLVLAEITINSHIH